MVCLSSKTFRKCLSFFVLPNALTHLMSLNHFSLWTWMKPLSSSLKLNIIRKLSSLKTMNKRKLFQNWTWRLHKNFLLVSHHSFLLVTLLAVTSCCFASRTTTSSPISSESKLQIDSGSKFDHSSQ